MIKTRHPKADMDVGEVVKVGFENQVGLELGVILGWNKAGYTASLVACGWAVAVFEVIRAVG